MEVLLHATGGKIIAATRFMRQKAFQKEDRKDRIYIYPPLIYHIVLWFSVIFSKEDIHIFEEEPQLEKRILFNTFKKNVYVSMYREPFIEYAEHLKKYKKLKAVYVEMDEYRDKLIKYGLDSKIVHVTYTPAKINRKRNIKEYNPKNVNLLFASWNNAEGDPLKERGLIYLLDFLVFNKETNLTVLLRDKKTKEFLEEVNKRNLNGRVRLVDVEEKDLEKEFDNTDYVVFAIQKKLTKDVPNSLIDGLSRGKPLILSTVFGLSRVVEKEQVGFVIEPNTKPFQLNISVEKYKKMSTKAYNLSQKYTNKNYVDSIIKNYEKKVEK